MNKGSEEKHGEEVSVYIPPSPSRTVHVLGIAHTVPHEDYTVCAFTTKVLLFPEVIQPFGWWVVEYSNEGSASQAREHVVILTKERLRALSKRTSRDEPMDADVNNEELRNEFQRILVEKVKARARPGDIICHVWGPNMEIYNEVKGCHHLESSVGYTASPGLPFRVYESSAWMHFHYGKAGQEDGNNYKWVIPSAFDTDRWRHEERPDDYAIYLGRITARKGINTLVEIARRMPNLPIRAYGPEDPAMWAKEAPPNLKFMGPVFGEEKVEVMRRARCKLMPTTFIEPFGFSGIEAQLCGVPLIATSYGAFQETIIEGVTGYRCHTLADWVAAIQLSSSLDRRAIADLARRRYSKDAVGRQYDWTLRQLADLSGPGWYGEHSRKFEALTRVAADATSVPKIWLCVPYFGQVPNYFQVYLDSLGRNQDCLRVVFLTDIDLSGFDIPSNFIRVPVTLADLRHQLANFIETEFGCEVDIGKVIPYPYKLVDFKILYPEVFAAVLARLGAAESDFVGWGDVDVVYGRVSQFLALDRDYDLIGGFHGHLTAVRNTSRLRQLFKRVPQLLDLLLSSTQHATDEIAFREPLLAAIQEYGLRMFYINRYFCDVVASRYVADFREDVTDPDACFFDAYNVDRDILDIRINEDGRLIVRETSGNDREVVYCHFQKRSMRLDVDARQLPLFVRRDGFYAQPAMPRIERETVT